MLRSQFYVGTSENDTSCTSKQHFKGFIDFWGFFQRNVLSGAFSEVLSSTLLVIYSALKIHNIVFLND